MVGVPSEGSAGGPISTWNEDAFKAQRSLAIKMTSIAYGFAWQQPM